MAVTLVTLATLAIGTWGLRFSRTTSDFFVASRTVGPRLNASAIGGEYLSAASFLGVAGLLLVFGADMLWYPVGWTAGYLVLLVLVAAPLRRSGAYTLPDFAEARLGSRRVRAACSVLVVLIGWLYLLPQFQGASVTLTAAIGAPRWLGAVDRRGRGAGERHQRWHAQHHLRPGLPVLAQAHGAAGPGGVPPRRLVRRRRARPGHRRPAAAPTPGRCRWARAARQGLYVTYSLIVATFLGTMGLPHVVVRFYTNPDGRAARRTTLVVLGLLGMFYLLPPVYAALGRVYAPELIGSGHSDVLVLELPRLMLPGTTGDLLTGLVTAGAFAAFLSTSSGLAIAVAGVLSQDVTGRRFGAHRLSGVTAFRVGAVIAVVVPCALALSSPDVGVARTVGPRLRRGRLDVLPAPGARHLVARAHRTRCGGRAAGRRAGLGSRRGVDPGDQRHHRLGRPCCSASRRPGACPPPRSRWWS